MIKRKKIKNKKRSKYKNNQRTTTFFYVGIEKKKQGPKWRNTAHEKLTLIDEIE